MIWTGRDSELAVVNCAACGRALGIAPSFRRVFRVVYCDEIDWHKPHIYDIENEDRDRQVRAVATFVGLGHAQLADAFGISRSRVQQIVAPSNDHDYLLHQPSVTSDVVRETRSKAGKRGGAIRWGSEQAAE
jgi:hypothetical protein